MSPGEMLLELQALLAQARGAEQAAQVLQAELLYLQVLARWPDNVEASTCIARFAMQRDDPQRAVGFLQRAADSHPGDPALAVDLAVALVSCGRLEAAIAALESTLARSPAEPTAWLLLGQLRDEAGHRAGALKAWFQAITRARRMGQWTGEGNTPPALVDAVVNAIAQLRTGRRELFFGTLDDLRRQHGAQALRRVDRALSGYLREWDATPVDERQRPKFFYFPDLPDTPYYDPMLQPWARRLEEAFPQIRAEALRVVAEDGRLPNFVDVPAGTAPGHLGGDAADPSWEAFFFYRHGERYDANHARCPQTSRVLEAIELCRIADQAPEILFSVLRPGTDILAHHGVTNVRLVMHLPLVVPPDCALNLVDRGEHRWQEGKLVMFDDTFLHEAWNRSDTTRIVLLMDCWNPHLTGVEKAAVTQLIETISGLQSADRVRDAVTPEE